MADVVSDQRWGTPTMADPGTMTENKNGWLNNDSDNGKWLVNSLGIITIGGQRYLVAAYSQHHPDLRHRCSTVEPGGGGGGRGAARVNPPLSDDDVPAYWQALGLPGLADIHVHFLPERMRGQGLGVLRRGEEHYGRPWPVRYTFDEPTRWNSPVASACAAYRRSATRTSGNGPVSQRLVRRVRRPGARRRPLGHAVPEPRRR